MIQSYYVQERVRRVNVITESQVLDAHLMAPDSHISYVVPDDQRAKFIQYIAYVLKEQGHVSGERAPSPEIHGVRRGIEFTKNLLSLGYNVLSSGRNSGRIIVRGDSTRCLYLPEIDVATQFFSLASTVQAIYKDNGREVGTDFRYTLMTILDYQQSLGQKFLDKDSLTVSSFIPKPDLSIPEMRISLANSKHYQVGFRLEETGITFLSGSVRRLYDNCFAKRG